MRKAATNLIAYLDEQFAAAGAVPDDRTIVIERSRDDLGDWRVAVLSPLGSRVHAPWAMAATARIRDEAGVDVEVMWSDDGFVIRYPDGERPPDTSLLLPDPDEVERLVVRQLGSTAMFSARFREAAGRALLLPRRRPGARAPLWQLRKRASDLLAVAARFGSFPIILETYRECLRDIFDLPALTDIMRRVRSRSLRVVNVESQKPSPFSASLLFGYVANYIYDGDAPLAERRAQALSVDQSQLRDLIGDTELRDLLDESVLDTLEQELQHLPDALSRALDRRGSRSAAAPRRSEPRRDRGTMRIRRRGAGDRRARQDEAGAHGPHRRRGAAHRRRGCRALSRCDRRAVAARAAGHAARTGRRSRRRSGAPIRPDARTVHQQGRHRASRSRRRRGRCRAAASARERPSGRRRIPAGRARTRVVRRRSVADGPATIARATAPGSRAGRVRGTWSISRRLAFARPPTLRPGRFARRDRTTAGRADRGVGARRRDPAGPQFATIRRRCSTRCWARAK